MTPQEAAAEVLRREAASPGSVPPAMVERARGLAGGTGKETLPEVKIQGSPMGLGEAIGRDVTGAPGGGNLVEDLADVAKQAGGAVRAGGDAFINSALLGVPDAIGKRLTNVPGAPDMKAALGETGPDPVLQARQEHPNFAAGGDIAGYASKINPANAAASGLVAGAKGLLPGLAERGAGRVISGLAQGGIGGALGAGGRTAVEGGNLEQVGDAATTGGLAGSALGTAGALVGEGARGIRGLIRGQVPEIAQAEAGGAKMSALRGATPGPEMSDIESASKVAGANNPSDYQASRLVKPLIQSGNAEVERIGAQVKREVQSYVASPEGQKLRPMDKLLDSYSEIYGRNVASESGQPLAEAELTGLKQSINNLAKVKLVGPGENVALETPGSRRLSFDEAQRKGFDVSTAARELQNPEQARFMDVLVTPRRYNAKDLLQDIQNLEQQVAESPKDRVLKEKLSAAMAQRDAFPGLSEMRHEHEQLLGGTKDELSMAQVPYQKGEQYVGANDEKALFNNISGYGSRGRYGPAEQALESQSTKAGQRPQLDMMKALRALEDLRGKVPTASIGATGRPRISVPARSAATRIDPIMELLMGPQGALPGGIGALAGQRKPLDILDF